MRINDELFYPQPIVSNALKYNETGYTYNSPLNLCCGMYSYNGSNSGTAGYDLAANNSGFFPTNTNFTFFGGINQLLNLTGNCHSLGINVSNTLGDSDAPGASILVNQKPIELIVTWFNNPDSNLAYQNITFCEVLKMLSIKDGQVQIQDQIRTLQAQ